MILPCFRATRAGQRRTATCHRGQMAVRDGNARRCIRRALAGVLPVRRLTIEPIDTRAQIVEDGNYGQHNQYASERYR